MKGRHISGPGFSVFIKVANKFLFLNTPKKQLLNIIWASVCYKAFTNKDI